MFVDGNAVTLLETGADYFPALEAAIDSATTEVYLETYIFENDATGQRIADSLICAAKRGVTVRVLVDGFGARAFVDRVMPVLEDGGVSVLIYRREIRALSLRRHRLRRLHRKLAVIDATVAFVGGINIIDDLDPAGPMFPRHDYAVRVEGPLLKPIVASVHRMWWLVSWASMKKRVRRPMAPRLRTAPVGSVRAAFLIRDNLRHRRDIEDAYLQAIQGARSEVIIACAYFFPGRRFRQALTVASARGVKVVLLLQGLSDHPTLAYATRALYPYLLGRGIRLFEYHRSYLHAKVAVVDRRWATVGSSNIDPFSLLMAREANVVVDDAGFALELHESLTRAMHDGASELRHEDWGRLPAIRRFASWLAYQFVRLAIGAAGYRGKH
ncbi:MAG TPA: cardiolipin synthase ClsB [Rhodocyclaceae bacterium]|nr:cardiolipin synthase ClsB [Rhodocyclaceae bacterium]HRQ47664.1 cardiolipin synthase ClsB [Rhodocyclaceae bacterium]